MPELPDLSAYKTALESHVIGFLVRTVLQSASMAISGSSFT